MGISRRLPNMETQIQEQFFGGLLTGFQDISEELQLVLKAYRWAEYDPHSMHNILILNVD